jgi:hypothetical protein
LYGRSLLHLKNRGFEHQLKINDSRFATSVETHGLVRFFLVMVQVGDSVCLRTALDEFCSFGVPSAFIIECFLEELLPKFFARVEQVLLILTDKNNHVLPHRT